MPLSSLNAEQRAAATAPLGHNLIIASAGTGKTSTIVGRIAHLLHNGVNPEKILLLTFTNKASAEMIERVGRHFDEKLTKGIEAGTFHAVAYRYLKQIGRDVSLKQPGELKALFKSVHEKRNFSLINPDSKPYSAVYLYDLYSLYVNSGSGRFSEWMMEHNAEHEPYLEIYEDIVAEFAELKAEYGYADYNDLLLFFRTEAKERGGGFSEILVDEYQDTNILQQSVIESLTPDSLFCVGDYDQSIYAFNGADINIIAGFDKRHMGARVYSLTKNYRSTVSILQLADRVISQNERIYPKKLEVVRSGSDVAPRLLVYEELFLQYQAIAKKIALCTRNHAEVAVIFRNNASADGIEASLREQGIASKRKGGISFFDSKEIRALLDGCTILFNPKDMMAFLHLLTYGKGIGNALAKDLFEALMVLGEGDLRKGLLHPADVANPFKNRVRNVSLGLFDDFYELGSVSRFAKEGYPESFLSNPVLKHPRLTPEGVRFLYQFVQMLQSIHAGSSPSTVIQKLAASEFFNEIRTQLGRQRSTNKEGEINLEKQQEALERIDRKTKLLKDLAGHYRELGRFLNAMILGSGEMSEGEGVNLLSVHASKGLEFEEVYIIDLMDGRFPNRKLMAKGGNIEEERRLFYVAVTRAKDVLYLSYAKTDAIKNIAYPPSQFLYESGLLKEE